MRRAGASDGSPVGQAPRFTLLSVNKCECLYVAFRSKTRLCQREILNPAPAPILSGENRKKRKSIRSAQPVSGVVLSTANDVTLHSAEKASNAWVRLPPGRY